MSHEIANMLVLSTGHLTENCCEEFLKSWPHAYPKGDYGWFVWVPSTDCCELLDADVLKCLYDCFVEARKSGCSWIMFEQCAEQIKELPTYRW